MNTRITVNSIDAFNEAVDLLLIGAEKCSECGVINHHTVMIPGIGPWHHPECYLKKLDDLEKQALKVIDTMDGRSIGVFTIAAHILGLQPDAKGNLDLMKVTDGQVTEVLNALKSLERDGLVQRVDPDDPYGRAWMRKATTKCAA